MTIKIATIFPINLLLVLFIISNNTSAADTNVWDDTKKVTLTLNDKIERIKKSIESQDTEQSLILSKELRNYGLKNNDTKSYLYGLIYMAESLYISNQEPDSIKHLLNDAYNLAKEVDDNWSLATIKNLQGSLTVYVESDFTKGLSYLLEGIEYAKKSGDPDRMFPLKSNIALAYYFRNDTDGLKYALEVYELGKQYDNEFITFIGSVISSYLYRIKGQTDSAMNYIRFALPLAEKYSDQRGVHALYADILMDIGKEDEAAHNYLIAMEEGSDYGRFSDADAHLGYGKHLAKEGRYKEALEIISEGIQIAQAGHRTQKLDQLYKTASSIYDSLHNYKMALKYYRLYNAKSDSIFNVKQEKAVSKLRVELETVKYQNYIKAKELRWQKQMHMTILFLCMAITVAVMAVILYYRKESEYRKILKLRQEASEKEKWYKSRLDSYPIHEEAKEESCSYTDNAEQDKLYRLFSELEKLMKEQKLYTRPDLTRDIVAKMLSTNRTYLSEAISKYTGLSFVYYVNSFRINEAVIILSDPNDDTPIKAIVHNLGFRSISTFYRLFQAAKGVPPSQFREDHKNDVFID